MKWDIDAALVQLEPETSKGTILQRVFVELGSPVAIESAKRVFKGVIFTPAQHKEGVAQIWSLGLGFAMSPKAFVYGQTIREAYLRARRLAKKGQLASVTPWGDQPFQPVLKKTRPKMKKRKKKKSQVTR